MWSKNLRTFFKHLLKNKLYSIVTIVGFSISLSFVIILSVYVKQEYSVDDFQVKKDRIFRAVHDDDSGFAPPCGGILQEKFPEIESYTRIYDNSGIVTGVGDKKVKIEYLMADSTFFNIFSFNLIRGTSGSALETRHSAVLTETTARELFGDQPAMGQKMTIDGVDFLVSGIMEDMPDYTHFKKCDAILNFRSLADIWGWRELLTSHSNNSFGLYFLAKKNTNLPAKDSLAFDALKEVNWMYQRGYAKNFTFEPLSECYFSHSSSSGIRQNNKTLVRVLSAIVLLILALSIVNYINLTISQSGFRSKEVAVKRLMGNSKKQLVFQFLCESTLLSLVSLIIAFLLSLLTEPVFNHLLGTHLGLIQKLTVPVVLSAFGFALGVGFISGIVPALAITRFNSVEVIKGTFRYKNKASYSRWLIAFQFTVVIALLMSTWIISKQTSYLRDYDLGYQKDNIIWVDNTIDREKTKTFQGILENIPGVEQVCFVAGSPIDGGNNNSFDYNGKHMSFQTFLVDTTFFNMMGMKVRKTGVSYSKNVAWLNETAVREMELDKNAVSTKIYGEEVPLYGIVRDFNFRSLTQSIGPAYFRPRSEDTFPWQILIKISGKNVPATLGRIKSAYADFTEGLPIEIGFFDDTVRQWYESQDRTAKIVGSFTLLAIVIATMGILAMSIFYTQQRTKEIGIRKVNGAKIAEVMAMLNKDFVQWVIVAFLIATPVAYYVMDRWLESFAYRTSLDWWIFALSGLLALGVALLTVSWQSWKAATRNPVEALRYE